MQVSRWGNSLAVRFPAGLVQALDLKEGDDIDLHLVDSRSFEVTKKTVRGRATGALASVSGSFASRFSF
jgi:antitoxin MazE